MTKKRFHYRRINKPITKQNQSWNRDCSDWQWRRERYSERENESGRESETERESDERIEDERVDEDSDSES